MKFSEGVVGSAATVDELLTLVPAARGVFQLFLKLGIFQRVFVEEARSPVGWWEWLWSLFGWEYKEVVEYVHLDLLYLVAWFLLVVMGGLLLRVTLCLIRLGLQRLGQLILMGMALVAQGIARFFMRVFRVLASNWDPGSTGKVLVPSAAHVPYHTESIRPNSILTAFEMPGCQVIFGTLSGERFVAYGCGVRINVPNCDDAFIITPLHVVCSLPSVFHLRGKNGTIEVDKKSVKRGSTIKPRDYVELDTDMCAFPISAVEASQIGVSVASILTSADARPMLARVTGPAQEGSTGELRADPYVFGQLVYSGSTVAGFSGAAYLVGKQVVGVHMSGGARNVGYSLRLAYVTLLYFLKVKQETTEEWLEMVVKKRKHKVYIDASWQHLDTVRIRVRGEYHIVERETWNNFELTEEDPVEPVYDDGPSSVVRNESKNLNLPTNLASDSSSESPQEVILKLRQKINNQKETLKGYQEKLNRFGKKPKETTSGHLGAQTPESQS